MLSKISPKPIKPENSNLTGIQLYLGNFHKTAIIFPKRAVA